MSELLNAFVFWANIYGPQIVIVLGFGFSYWITPILGEALGIKLTKRK